MHLSAVYLCDKSFRMLEGESLEYSQTSTLESQVPTQCLNF